MHIALMVYTIATFLKLMLYEGNDFPSFYFTRTKLKHYVPCKP